MFVIRDTNNILSHFLSREVAFLFKYIYYEYYLKIMFRFFCDTWIYLFIVCFWQLATQPRALDKRRKGCICMALVMFLFCVMGGLSVHHEQNKP